MERLALDNDALPYNATEAAIHLSRYQLVVPHCREKRILDVACGEGYGSYYLSSEGQAKSVDGVDSSEQAINSAKALFNQESIKFHKTDACFLEDYFGEEKFDLIVSIETIEHIPNPESFLESIKRVGTSDCQFIVSCPNDYWYYPSTEQNNPYHIRKYHFNEFQELATSILGDNVQWGLGVPVMGFGIVPALVNDEFDNPESFGQIEMIKVKNQSSSTLVPSEPGHKPDETNCSYFVGFWGANEYLTSSTIHSVSMDIFQRISEWRTPGRYISEEYFRSFKSEIARLNRHNEVLEKEIDKLKFITSSQTFKDELNRMNSQNDKLENELRKLKLIINSPLTSSKIALKKLINKFSR